ncbi:MAG: hypothetical protein JSW50_06840, partial [Candidatus Latescibacterota bacterium]
LFAGAAAFFVLGFLIFSKLFPLISIWEMQEGREKGVEEVTERLKSYLPQGSGKSSEEAPENGGSG